MYTDFIWFYRVRRLLFLSFLSSTTNQNVETVGYIDFILNLHIQPFFFLCALALFCTKPKTNKNDKRLYIPFSLVFGFPLFRIITYLQIYPRLPFLSFFSCFLGFYDAIRIIFFRKTRKT